MPKYLYFVSVCAVVAACSDDSEPTSVTIMGDVTITSAADIDALGCVGAIEGNLTVAPTSPTDLSFPCLVTVTQNVDLTLPVTASSTGPFAETRCEGESPSSVVSIITRIDLPNLTAIGGDLTIDAPSDGVPTTFGEPIEVGLDALTNLDGDLEISFATPAVEPCGLSGLSAAPGDVTIAFANADVAAQKLLPGLSEVEGKLSVSGGFTVLNLLGSMSTAGALELSSISNLAPTALASVTSVAGPLVLTDLSSNPVLMGLSSAGSLTIDDVSIASLGSVGTSAIQVGDLTLTANANLSSLTSGGASNIDFTPDASLTIGTGADANPVLSAAEVCTFVADQVSANGWTPMGTGFSCP